LVTEKENSKATKQQLLMMLHLIGRTGSGKSTLANVINLFFLTHRQNQSLFLRY